MKYVGGKARIGKWFYDYLQNERGKHEYFVDLFAGGFNVIQNFQGKRIGNDKNPYTPSLFQFMLQGWKPPTKLSSDRYYELQEIAGCGVVSPFTLEAAEIGFAGFALSFGGKFFAGKIEDPANGRGRMRYTEALRSLDLQVAKLQGCTIMCLDYRDVSLPKDALIYCDIPYEGTLQYNSVGSFSHELFWDWARKQSATGYNLVVSSYEAPEDFTCVASGTKHLTLSAGDRRGMHLMQMSKRARRLEKLFKLIQR